MKALIIEDEKPAARKLERMLQAQGVEVVTKLHSVADAVQWLQQNEHPPLFMVDIQLNDGLSFEIFEQIQTKSFLIFTTAYDEYSLKAFKLNSIDYLLKPINKEELTTALNKFKQYLPMGDSHIQPVLQGIYDAKNYKKRIVLKIGNQLKPIDVQDVNYFYSEYKVTYLHTDKSYPMEGSLEELESQLDPKDFFRINRQIIVNRGAIQHIAQYENHRLKLRIQNALTEEIIVSRERVRDFKEWLE